MIDVKDGFGQQVEEKLFMMFSYARDTKKYIMRKHAQLIIINNDYIYCLGRER